ncbi:MAG: hypothetical protein JWR03_568 [Cohnella sp.]|jgi:hypothetical protein|nr:hypothetical protein [Cohnella sp.]
MILPFRSQQHCIKQMLRTCGELILFSWCLCCCVKSKAIIQVKTDSPSSQEGGPVFIGN